MASGASPGAVSSPMRSVHSPSLPLNDEPVSKQTKALGAVVRGGNGGCRPRPQSPRHARPCEPCLHLPSVGEKKHEIDRSAADLDALASRPFNIRGRESKSPSWSSME